MDKKINPTVSDILQVFAPKIKKLCEKYCISIESGELLLAKKYFDTITKLNDLMVLSVEK